MLDRRSLLVSGVALALAASTRTSQADAPDEQTFAAVNRDIVLNHIAPRFATFAEACTSLQATLADYKNGIADIESARLAYRDAMDAWMGAQHLRLGPLQVDGRIFRIQFWPDSRNRGGRQLGEVIEEQRTDLVDDQEMMAGASVAIQGFPALERILFEIEPAPGDYAVGLAAAIARNLAAISAELTEAWRPDGIWGPALWDPDSSETAYPAPSQASSALLLNLVTQLDIMVHSKLREPLGESIERARPRLAESWRSARSLRNVRINLDALGHLYDGGDGRFLFLLQHTGNTPLALAIGLDLSMALTTLALLPDDIEPMITDETGRETLMKVADHIDSARQALSGEAASDLGLLLGFNSLDGD